RETCFALLVGGALSPSCSKHRDERDYNEYMAHYLQAQNGYCSTNIAFAEQSLLEFRTWLKARELSGKPRFNYHLNLLQVDGRLFLLYEYEGNSEKAEFFYREGTQAHNNFLRSQGSPEHTLTKEE